jgi:hypothetical protein
MLFLLNLEEEGMTKRHCLTTAPSLAAFLFSLQSKFRKQAHNLILDIQRCKLGPFSKSLFKTLSGLRPNQFHHPRQV